MKMLAVGVFFITRSSKYDIKFSLFLLLYFHYYNFVVAVLLFIFIFNVHFAFYIISPCPVIAHLQNIYQSRQSIINHANLQIKHHTKNTLFTQSTCPNASQQTSMQINNKSIIDPLPMASRSIAFRIIHIAAIWVPHFPRI